jgi:hypothetical protein
MKGGAQVALAVGVGYILGRRRKMRLATMVAVGAATGGIGGLGPAVLKRGMKYLGSTDVAGALGPQVNEIVSTIRGDLLDAGKAAATAAVSSRIDSLSDTLHDRAETFRNPEAAVAGAGEAAGKAGETVGRAGGKAGETVGRAGGSVGRLRRRRPAEDEEYAERDNEERRNGRSRRPRRAERPEPDEAEAEAYEDEEPQSEYEDEDPESEYEDEEPQSEYEDEQEEPEPVDDADEEEVDEDATEEPAPRRRRTSRSPVTRTRR